MKKSPKFWVAVALVLCIVSSLGASLFQTDFGKIDYHDMTFVTASGHELDALLLVPETATAETKAPAIVVSHGWYNNREMQDLNYVEYARRGYVVLAISMYGHGDSQVIASNTWWDDENNANGLYDGVKYVASLPFVDSSRIGVTGHSNGALASREAVLQDSEGLIAAALLVSNDAVYYDENGNLYNMFGDRDAAIVACQYDEFFHRVDGNPPREYIHQVTAQSFLNFGGAPDVPEREPGVFYDRDGVIRSIYNPPITHPWAHFSKNVVAFSVDFFDRALGAPNPLEHGDQIWQWKAAFNALGVIGFFLFLPNAALALLEVPAFAGLKSEVEIKPWPALAGKEKKKYFSSNIWGAVLSIVFYFLAFVVGYILWQSEFFNQGASRIIGLWSALCGVFTLLTLKLRKRSTLEKTERGIRVSRKTLGKTVALSLTVVAAAFAIVFVSDWLLLTDYRLWCFATIRAFDAMHLGMILRFVPFWLVYYIAMSVAGNCTGYTVRGKKDGASVAWQMLFVALGPVVMIAVQYITFFITGFEILDPITGIMGIWLFPIAIILPVSALISHVIYKKTRNPYIGGIITAIIACILTVTNTLTG